MKYVSLLIDLDVFVDSTTCYEKTWSKEFIDFIAEISQKGKRLLQLEVGDSFTMGITDDREVFSWGLND